MSQAISINGVSYSQPDQGTPPPWGDVQATIIVALVNSTLQKIGGTFTLTNDADFGASKGLKSLYYKSRATNVSTTGVVRLGNDEGVGFRNFANGADVLEFNGTALSTFANPMTTNGDIIARIAGVAARLAIGTSGQVLTVSAGGIPEWSSVPGTGDVVGPAGATNNAVPRFDGTTGKLLQDSDLLVDDLGNMSNSGGLDLGDYLAVGGSVISPLVPDLDATYDLGGSIKQWQRIYGTTIYSGSLTASRLLLSGASKELVSSSVTSTEAGYLAGVTSAIQTQIDTKVTSPTWTTFTPTVTLVGGAGNTVPTYSSVVARYIQIGKIVHVSIKLGNNSGGTAGAGTGAIFIALPIAASASDTNNESIPSGTFANGAATNIVHTAITASASTVALLYQNAIGTAISMTGAQQNDANIRHIGLKFFYEVA